MELIPNIIGLSSEGQYTNEPFVYSFVDYLAKPVSYSSFYRAVDKAVRYYSVRILKMVGTRRFLSGRIHNLSN